MTIFQKLPLYINRVGPVVILERIELKMKCLAVYYIKRFIKYNRIESVSTNTELKNFLFVLIIL